jgi:signal transduction histidine kinase
MHLNAPDGLRNKGRCGVPIQHVIDHEQRLVVAAGHGLVTDDEVFAYQREVWTRADVAGYDELIDLSHGDIAAPSSERLAQLAKFSAASDAPQSARLAIVAPQEHLYAMSRAYKRARRQSAGSTKEVGVFRELADAVEFLHACHPAAPPRVPLASAPSGEPAAFDAGRVALAREKVDDRHSLRDARRSVAGLVGAALGVARVGVWLYEDHGRAIRCLYNYQPAGGAEPSGMILRTDDFPAYFRQAARTAVIAVPDVQTEPAVAELIEPYWNPLGVAATLDAPIYRGGALVGLVCHEHIGAPRAWTADESALAATTAETIARLLEEAARREAEASLGEYQQRIQQLERAEALGRMAAGVAHDFRNLLTIILGHGDLLALRADLPAEAQANVRQLLEAAERGSSLTHELLTFARQSPCAPQVLDPCEVARGLLNILKFTVGPQVELSAQLTAGARVFMDGSQLERVLLNLVLNARDALPGGGRIEIVVRDVTEGAAKSPERFVVVEVRDDGVGMSEDVQNRLFEPFYSTKGGQGSGLGMPIVQQIVTRAGGFLRVASTLGKGTSVQCYLPPVSV